MKKTFTLLLVVMINLLGFTGNLSAQTCGTATRTAVDCKFGTPDAIGWAMQQFFSDGSTASWNFESGAVFQENADGSAVLTGTITQYGSSPKRSFAVVVNFTGKSATTTGTPETNNLCPVPSSTSSWWYYTLSSGSLTGIAGTPVAGGKVTLKQHMMPSQYGIGGANQCLETNNLGLTGWFEYQIVSQPTNTALSILPYSLAPVIGQADLCIRLSGTPTNCNPCDTDKTPPVFANCPANITLNTSCACANANWTAPTVTDNCSTPTVSQTAGGANGSCFNVGITTVTYTATDAKGNKAICSFTVTVNASSSITRTVTNSTECSNGTLYGIYLNTKYYTFSNAVFTENADLTATLTGTTSLGAVSIKFTGRTTTGTAVFGGCFTPASTSDWYYYNNFTGTIGSNAIVSNPMHKFQVGTSANNQNNKVYGASGWYTGSTGNGDINILLSGNTSTLTQISCPTVAPCKQPTTPSGWMYLGQYNNNFYYKNTSGDCNYYTAKSYASNVGGHLAYGKDAGEISFLKGAVNGTCWLGIERFGNDWKCGDGSISSYSNWNVGEPNNYGGCENSVQMYSDGHWNDISEVSKCWAVAVIPCSGAVAPDCYAGFDQSKVYKCISRKTGKCLDVSGGSRNAKASVQLWDYWGGDNQKWSVVPTSGGYCKLIAQHSGKVLSSTNTWSGSQLCQDDYATGWWGTSSNVDKEWKIECYNGGQKLTHKSSGRSCHSGGGYSNGTHCQISDWNASDEETFDIVEVPKGNGVYLQNTKVLTLSAVVEPNRTRIEWLNNTGTINDVFQVQKLNATTGDFETISTVKTIASTDMETYIAYDVKPTEGDNFYRINVAYLDGTNTISEVQKVNFKGFTGNVSIFPNPADDVLNVDLSSYKGASVSLFVYNHLGQAVITQQIDKVVDGVVQVDISNQQMGNYLLRIASKGKRDETQSFILNK